MCNDRVTIPDWRLPTGVSRGTWDYAQSRSVAEGYDAYHGDNPLFAYEAEVLREAFGPPPPSGSGVIADFGCGSGRALVPLVRDGWRGLAIDLSEAMLDVVRGKAAAESLAIECVAANLAELSPEAVPDASADHGMCLFSTLGMIRGRASRIAALAGMRRVVRPGGRLVVHAHNFWFNLRDPGGPWWALESLARGAVAAMKGDADRYQTGDKTYPYRGVPNFFLHAYRRRELTRELREAGWCVRRWAPLDVARRHALASPWFAQPLRANGWLVVAVRPGSKE